MCCCICAYSPTHTTTYMCSDSVHQGETFQEFNHLAGSICFLQLEVGLIMCMFNSCISSILSGIGSMAPKASCWGVMMAWRKVAMRVRKGCKPHSSCFQNPFVNLCTIAQNGFCL